MSQMERIYKIHRLLETHRAVPLRKILEELEISRATAKRDIQFLRDRLQAPIVYDRELGGYHYSQEDPSSPDSPRRPERYQLPGIWLTSAEMTALLLMRDFLEQLDSRVLVEALGPAMRRIESLIGSSRVKERDFRKRFRILAARHRPVDDQIFRIVSTALIRRRRLELVYFSRSRGEIMPRIVSPQRLIWYNSNWYLDAWCHLREDFRSFALDAIRGATMQMDRAEEYPLEVLDARLGAGYGIFAGEPDKTAVLRFRLPASRWIEREEWHPKQRLTPLGGGEVRLEVPYSDPRELVQDILRFAPDVVVEAPDSLRELVMRHLEDGLSAMRAERRKPAASAQQLSRG
jgi:predicted DNA-binding transcriptional regulator YafY